MARSKSSTGIPGKSSTADRSRKPSSKPLAPHADNPAPVRRASQSPATTAVQSPRPGPIQRLKSHRLSVSPSEQSAAPSPPGTFARSGSAGPSASPTTTCARSCQARPGCGDAPRRPGHAARRGTGRVPAGPANDASRAGGRAWRASGDGRPARAGRYIRAPISEGPCSSSGPIRGDGLPPPNPGAKPDGHRAERARCACRRPCAARCGAAGAGEGGARAGGCDGLAEALRAARRARTFRPAVGAGRRAAPLYAIGAIEVRREADGEAGGEGCLRWDRRN